jgi:N-acetylmuramoyl-L-alanine amidase
VFLYVKNMPARQRYIIAGCFFCIIICVIVFSSVKKSQSALSLQAGDIDFDRTVIIDPGHGGVDGGAVGYNGIIEKNINLNISLKLRDIFEASGFRVVMTREDDSSIHDEDSVTIRQKKVSDIHNRSKLLEKYPDAIFLSIHQNKFSQSQYSGTQVFYSKNNDDSKMLAEFIRSSVKDMIQPNNEREIKPAGKNLYILYHAKSPAVMVECGFLSNPQESVMLQDDEYQKKLAFAVYCGVLEYYS